MFFPRLPLTAARYVAARATDFLAVCLDLVDPAFADSDSDDDDELDAATEAEARAVISAHAEVQRQKRAFVPGAWNVNAVGVRASVCASV